jgi:hypothetical protein
VHYQVCHGCTLTAPAGAQGTYWTYLTPLENIQERVIEASEEAVSENKITALTLLYCGPVDQIPTTSIEVGGITVTWVSSLPGWTCTLP